MSKDFINISYPESTHDQRAMNGMFLAGGNSFYEEMQPSASWFYNDVDSCIFNAICEIYKDGDMISLQSVTAKLEATGKLDRPGKSAGIINIKSLTQAVNYDFEEAPSIRKRLIDFVGLRELRTNYLLGLEQINSGKDISEILSSIESVKSNIEERIVTEKLASIKDGCKRFLIQLDKNVAALKKGRSVGVLTGVNRLDQMTAGMQKGDTWVLAGRPGMGKSTFAINQVGLAAAQQGRHVVIFSLEMKEYKIISRLVLALNPHIDPEKLRTANLDDTEWKKVNNAITELHNLPIHIYDEPAITVSEISRISRQLKNKGQCDLVIIDYVGLITPETKSMSRNDEITIISRNIKKLAMALDVPVLLLSQLNRDVEKRSLKIPELSDLRDSGSIEQDASVVTMIYRPKYYATSTDENADTEQFERFGDQVLLFVKKNRDGDTGKVLLHANETVTRFSKFPFTDEVNPNERIEANQGDCPY